MNVEHFRSSQYHQSTWSGGKTTELFLFPPEANYQRRVFDYRISSATIEEQYSMFTVLPGYNRLLMPLEGSVTLTNSE
ncbi:HutD family protein, partial [Mycobacterium kansasii]